MSSDTSKQLASGKSPPKTSTRTSGGNQLASGTRKSDSVVVERQSKVSPKPKKLLRVSPVVTGKTRSLPKKIRNGADEALYPNSSRPFFDLTRGACQCWGLSACVHSPFFCVAEHSQRTLPLGRKTWNGAVFYPIKRLGWRGYGMGGAGDNAGGYLGGAYVPHQFVSATMEAISCVQRSDASMAELLPGRISAIGGSLISTYTKPKPASALGLSNGEFRLDEIIDPRTGKLKNPENYPTDAYGEPLVPETLKRRILDSAKLIGGGRPGLMTSAPRGIAGRSGGGGGKQSGLRAGASGRGVQAKAVGRMPISQLRGVTRRFNAIAALMSNRARRFGFDLNSVGGNIYGGQLGGGAQSPWLNDMAAWATGAGGLDDGSLTAVLATDPTLMALLGGESEGFEGAGEGPVASGTTANPRGSVDLRAPAGRGLNAYQALLAEAMRPAPLYTDNARGGGGGGKGSFATTLGGDGGSGDGGEGTMGLMNALDAALREVIDQGTGSFLASGMDISDMDMSQLRSLMGGATLPSTAKHDDAHGDHRNSAQRRMARRIQKLKQMRKLIESGQITIEEILAANEKLIGLTGADRAQGQKLVSVPPGTQLIPPSEQGPPGSGGGPGGGGKGGGPGEGGGPPPPPEPKKLEAKKLPPPPGGKKGPPPPPPPGGKKKAPPEKKKAAAGIGAGQGKRLRKMPWEALPTTEGTQFEEVGKIPVEVDKEQVETDFSMAVKAPTEGEKPAAKKAEVIKVLPDAKRAYTMSIATARITKMGFAALKDAINKLDPAILTPDACSTLIEYAPRADEIAAVEAFVDSGGDITKCDSPDQYVYALKDVKNLKQKLEAHAFALNFASELDELSLPVEKLKAACDCLRGSKRLPRFLFLVIRIGNVVNESNVKGIKLTSIPKLAEYKTTIKPIRNLLQYIVNVIMKGPDNVANEDLAKAMSHVTVQEALESLDMVEELKPLMDGCKVDLEALDQRIQKFVGSLRKTTTEVNKLSETDPVVDANLSPFVKAATKQVEELQTLVQDTKEAFAGAARYYGETDDSLKKLATHTYLSLPARLARDLQSIVKDIKEKQDREAKRLAAKSGKAVPKKAPPTSKAAAAAPESADAAPAMRVEAEEAPQSKVVQGAMRA